MNRRKVEVVPFQKSWKAAYLQEAEHLNDILGDSVLNVHHIGSTSISGMGAKPILDILIEARDIEKIDSHNGQMKVSGYDAYGENGIPGRRFFVKAIAGTRTSHVHIFAAGHPEVRRHLLFRDYLSAHPQEAAEYAKLKENLAIQFPADIDHYIDGKHDFIQGIDRKAAEWAKEAEGR
ncbi:GrpB family protein [Bacillus marinisedimentorum]|uniref:GrpB family protein n=1 Tax=Bacillus marinisedimentorum TaxID=1821260 RepID=UPI0008727154|nr:GrpB family protein [Bacillus marinisedimentorum]